MNQVTSSGLPERNRLSIVEPRSLALGPKADQKFLLGTLTFSLLVLKNSYIIKELMQPQPQDKRRTILAQSNRPQRATREVGGPVAQAQATVNRPQVAPQRPMGLQPIEEEGRPMSETHDDTGAGAATEQPKSAVTPPSEEELRKAREIVSRAKATGVKLSSAGGGTARIMLPTGEPRVAYIKRRWEAGVSRNQILKEIQSAGGVHEKCTYQIVFSATKGVPGGPDKGTETGEKQYSLAPKPEGGQQEAAE